MYVTSLSNKPKDPDSTLDFAYLDCRDKVHNAPKKASFCCMAPHIE
jgi:hypothetical protein